MKRAANFLSRIMAFCSPRKSKAGASLVMVVIIGAALSIWIMGVLPMMMGTGTTAANLMGSQNDYLSSRSALEFCKSELEKIVETDPPYTFAVINQGDLNNTGFSQFAVVSKPNILEDGKLGTGTNPDYTKYVNLGATNNEDAPQSNADGSKVAAICAATPDPEDAAKYDLVISTYSRGEKVMTYTGTYTLFGSLKINPEAYKQIQALPLDDYVLVDGILGGEFDESGNLTGEPNVIWNSTITGVTDKNFEEFLLPASNDTGYANAGKLSAVFKKTAQAALSESATSGEPIVAAPLTDATQGAVKPTAVANEAAATKNGDTWIDGSDGKAKMLLGGNVLTLTGDEASILYNGNTSRFGSGSYIRTLDVKGFTKDQITVLPAKGLHHGDWPASTIHNGSAPKLTAGIDTAFNQEENVAEFTVTAGGFKSTEGLQIGYTYDPAIDSANDITDWAPFDGSKKYEMRDFTGTVYFYVRQRAHFADNIFYPASNVAYAGYVSPFKSTSPTSGKEYMIVAYANNQYYAVSIGNNNRLSLTELNENHYQGTLGNGILKTPATKWQLNQNDSGWTIKSGNKYMNVTGSSASTDNNPVEHKITNNVISRQSGGRTYNLYVRVDTSWWNTTVSITSSRDSSTAFYFIPVPVEGNSEISKGTNGAKDLDYNVTYGQISYRNLWNRIEDDTKFDLEDLYLNALEVSASDTQIHSGAYQMIGKLKANDEYVSLGSLTVNPISNDALSISTGAAANDDLKVTVGASGWDAQTEQPHFFGYSVQQEDDTWSDYLWFTSAQSSYDFRLPVGNYKFAVAEHISGNCISREAESAPYTIQWRQLPEPTTNQFSYKVVMKDGAPEVTWYKLPDGVTPDRLTMVYGVYNTHGTQDTADDTVAWSLTYPTVVSESESVVYGILIAGTKYKLLDDGTLEVFRLSGPQDRTDVGGHQSSGITSHVLYFMGGSMNAQNGKPSSLLSFGNDIQLSADLLCFKHAPNGSYTDDAGRTTTGEIIVKPTPESKTGKVLMFSATAFGPFEAGQFYVVDAGTDILNPQEGQYSMVSGKSGANKVTASNGEFTRLEFCNAAETLFRKGEYPEPDLNVLFATQAQLYAIVSSETLGWTTAGVLSGSDNYRNDGFDSGGALAANAKSAVCVYVNRIDGAVDRMANRVFLVGKSSPTENNLSIPSNLTFCTRYLSIDAATVTGVSGNAFTITNLTEEHNILTKLFQIGGISKYISRTLQVEFERSTKIGYAGNSLRTEDARTRRCDTGTNLLGTDVSLMDLLVDYQIGEIEPWFRDQAMVVKSVERYLSIHGTKQDKTINIGDERAWFVLDSTWNVFANYIYFDENITGITINTGLIERDDSIISFNAQEYGYTDKDYLGLFSSNSEEAYNGLIVYFDQNVTVKQKRLLGSDKNLGTIEQGFYYVYAKDKSTDLIDLVDATYFTQAQLDANEGKNGARKPYKIRPEDLAQYTVYINPNDGTLSNAFVEPGIYGSDSSALGGFSGGNVE